MISLADLGAKLVPYLPVILLLTAIVIGVPIAYRHWRDAHEDQEPASGTELLTDLLRAEDKMTDAEFRRIRQLLVGAKGTPTEKSQSQPSPISSRGAGPAELATGASGESDLADEPAPPTPPPPA